MFLGWGGGRGLDGNRGWYMREREWKLWDLKEYLRGI